MVKNTPSPLKPKEAYHAMFSAMPEESVFSLMLLNQALRYAH